MGLQLIRIAGRTPDLYVLTGRVPASTAYLRYPARSATFARLCLLIPRRSLGPQSRGYQEATPNGTCRPMPLGHYFPGCDDLFIASNAASASSGRARTTKSSVRFTQRTFPDESIRNSAGREMSAPSRRPCTCTRSHLRITSSCASERIGNA